MVGTIISGFVVVEFIFTSKRTKLVPVIFFRRNTLKGTITVVILDLNRWHEAVPWDDHPRRPGWKYTACALQRYTVLLVEQNITTVINLNALNDKINRRNSIQLVSSQFILRCFFRRGVVFYFSWFDQCDVTLRVFLRQYAAQQRKRFSAWGTVAHGNWGSATDARTRVVVAQSTQKLPRHSTDQLHSSSSNWSVSLPSQVYSFVFLAIKIELENNVL